ncbi:MAG: hypothetical protein IJ088_03380 [Clostridia bacterium]|nr:hypothetical protein [Clostridia bacterium]
MNARLSALLCGIGAALAAPYLIPVEPESFVMRAGVFSALLVLFAQLALVRVFEQHPLRHLCRTSVPAFIFALALSVGTELFTYGAFLPGLGSALRRLFVPLLITPFLSAFIYRLSALSLPDSGPGTRMEGLLCFCLLLLLWTPILLAYWPGMLNYDFQTEYMQHLTGEYSLIHPLTHSALMISVISLGEHLVSRTFGLLLMSVFQMVVLAGVLTSACLFLRQHGISRPIVACLCLFFGLHPVFSVMAVSMTKDTLFTACLIGLVIQGIDLLEHPETFFIRKSALVTFVLCACGTALMRVNGLFALIPFFIALLLRCHSRKVLLLTAASLLTPLMVHLGLLAALHPVSLPSFQLYSLPAQQLVRAYNAGTLTETEKETLEGWYTSPDGLKVHPHLADPAKGYLDRDRLEREGSDFLSLWRSAAPHSAVPYLEAFLMLNIGSWYPDDLSHTTIYPDVSYNEKGYLQTQEYDMQEQGFHVTSYLPKVRSLYEQFCRYNRYLRYPFLPLLFSTAIPIWILVLSLTVRRLRGTPVPFAPVAAPIALFLSYLLGPCTLARYIMPLYALAPVFLLLSYSSGPLPQAKAR